MIHSSDESIFGCECLMAAITVCVCALPFVPTILYFTFPTDAILVSQIVGKHCVGGVDGVGGIVMNIEPYKEDFAICRLVSDQQFEQDLAATKVVVSNGGETTTISLSKCFPQLHRHACDKRVRRHQCGNFVSLWESTNSVMKAVWIISTVVTFGLFVILLTIFLMIAGVIVIHEVHKSCKN